MTNKRLLPLIFLLASHVFVSGVTSKNITIENKCDYMVWPSIFTSEGPQGRQGHGFALRKGEARAVEVPSLWSGIIWGRTLCGVNSTGKFSCATGDCGSGKIECSYRPMNTTLAEFKIKSTDLYRINVIYGYNLPLSMVPQINNYTMTETDICTNVICDVVNLNQVCPYELMVVDEEERPIACANQCQTYDCMTTPYSKSFQSSCPTSVSYDSDSNNYMVCPNFTDYVITFCPSFTPKSTRRKSPVTEFPSTTNTTNGTHESPNGTITRAKHKSPLKLKVILGISTALLVMIIIIVATTVVARAKNGRRKSDWKGENIEAVVMLKRYSYAKVKKMTNSFAHVLGKGGFGTVYKGKLPDGSGQDVAVKVFKELKGNGEEFINEVASMSRTSHVNIVSLLGFCYEGSKRAIIYEFMPNGSLDKFISESMSTKMEWKSLYNIVEGVARGLEYLHNRCVSRIVHFDIKPQNILMDEDLCPKISDFGLARLCAKKETIMSMLDARGTIGYIAPEVFSKSFGGVSHKSDVYSYGMVILEIIGAKNKESYENSRSNSSSMYFPDWIYKDLEREETMRLFGDQMTEEEDKIVRKMVLVGLWCIQTNPFDRPSMGKVVEMLEGSLEDLHVPPKPHLAISTIMVSKTLKESEEEISSLTPSQLESGTLSPCQDTLSFSTKFVQEIVEESLHDETHV